MSHVRALKGPVWVFTPPYGSAFKKTTIHGSCGPCTGSVWCLEVLTGPAQAVMTDYGQFAYGGSQACKAFAKAHTVPTRAQYGTRSVDVWILTHRAPICMWPCTWKKDDFIQTSQVLQPGTTGRHYAMLWSHAHGRSMGGYLHVLWSRGCKIPYVYLTGSIRFMCGHLRGPCGFHTTIGTSVHSVLREPYGPSPMQMPCGPGNTCMISGAGPYRVRWGQLVHTRVIFTKPNTIMWHLTC